MKLDELLLKTKTIKVAVIGSHLEKNQPIWSETARKIGETIAKRNKVLLCGPFHGLPAVSADEASSNGAWVVYISHKSKNTKNIYGISINTGFGYKGRNVILVRSADLVVVLPGGLGTLNEITIALDEKVPCYRIGTDLTVTRITKHNLRETIDKVMLY